MKTKLIRKYLYKVIMYHYLATGKMMLDKEIDIVENDLIRLSRESAKKLGC